MMFKRTKPCDTCPFKRGVGSTFRLPADRLDEIFHAVAFQCHKTVDYENFEDDRLRQGKRPQQCAGLMAVLHLENRPNQIMQVAERFRVFDPDRLDFATSYRSFDEARAAHLEGREP